MAQDPFYFFSFSCLCQHEQLLPAIGLLVAPMLATFGGILLDFIIKEWM